MHDCQPAQGRAGLMRRLVLVLSLGALSAGCGSSGWFGSSSDASRATAPPPLTLAYADDLLGQGRPLAAREIYARIAAEPERDARHASALYNLARLLTDPAAGPRDYRAAQLAFDRLLKEYPNGEWEADARAWNAALTDLAAREVELEARDGELRVREAELTRLKAESARLGSDLQRLKKIDLSIERRR
jgi:hypothetical protein